MRTRLGTERMKFGTAPIFFLLIPLKGTAPFWVRDLQGFRNQLCYTIRTTFAKIPKLKFL